MVWQNEETQSHRRKFVSVDNPVPTTEETRQPFLNPDLNGRAGYCTACMRFHDILLSCLLDRFDILEYCLDSRLVVSTTGKLEGGGHDLFNYVQGSSERTLTLGRRPRCSS